MPFLRSHLPVCALLILSGSVFAEPTPYVSWDAANPGGDPTNFWAPAINNSTATDANVSWNNNGGTLNPYVSPTLEATAVYSFGAGQNMTSTAGMWNTQITPADASAEDGTFEIWFRPDSFPVAGSPQYLHEAGGSGNGIAFYLDGTNLNWTIDHGSVQETLTVDLSGLDTSDLIQAVMVYDRTGTSTGGDDSMQIYINGEFVDSLTSAGILEDFDGGGSGALADFDGSLPETAPAGTDFIGDIALFNYYREALDANDVLLAFQVLSPPPPPLSPEPSSLVLMGAMTGIAGLVYWRRKRKLAA